MFSRLGKSVIILINEGMLVVEDRSGHPLFVGAFHIPLSYYGGTYARGERGGEGERVQAYNSIKFSDLEIWLCERVDRWSVFFIFVNC